MHKPSASGSLNSLLYWSRLYAPLTCSLCSGLLEPMDGSNVCGFPQFTLSNPLVVDLTLDISRISQLPRLRVTPAGTQSPTSLQRSRLPVSCAIGSTEIP